MANNKKIMEKLMGLSGANTGEKNVHNYVIRSSSPSFNFMFGNGHGLPAGYSAMCWGPYKGGKSIIANDMIGQLHKDDPDAWAIKFDTEFREAAQLPKERYPVFGIDPERYLCYSTNTPDNIFDRIEKELPAMIEDYKMDLKFLVIDSTTQIQGRRSMNAESVMVQQIGDEAKTIQDGLKRTLPIQRKYGFAMLFTSHVRAQMDLVEQMRGNKFRPAAAHGMQHVTEYNIFMEPNLSKEGKTDALGNTFINEGVEDLAGKGERTGHRIKCQMKDSSLGPKGRHGEFTLDYNKGIINQHEEVMALGVGYNIIEKVNNVTYRFGGKEFRGKPSLLENLKADVAMQEAVLQELRKRDLAGKLSEPVAEVEASPE